MDTVKGKDEMSLAIDPWISFVQVIQEKQCSQKTPRLNIAGLVLEAQLFSDYRAKSSYYSHVSVVT